MKVLFIGNSHTYFNDMPYMLECISNTADDKQLMQTFMLASPGKSLSWHYEQPEVRYNILYGNYDYIVLQDVAHPFEGIHALDEGIGKISEFIKKSNSKAVLYMTWAEKFKPENQEEMSSAYKKMAEKYNYLLAPVGAYFKKLQRESSIDLFFKDGEHASNIGSYVAACVMYKTITGKNALGAVGKIGNHTDCLNLSDEVKEYVQKLTIE